jgi:hypothetical protein
MINQIIKETPKRPNFSYHRITNRVTIEAGQHMMAFQLEITIDGSIDITDDGALVLL